MSTLPLLDRALKEAIFRDKKGHALSAGQFLACVYRLVEQLPEASHVINLCDDRLHFVASLCACVIRRQTTLLPQNRAAATLAQLQTDYPEPLIIHDSTLESQAKPAFRVDIASKTGSGDSAEIPSIPSDFLAVIAFTSGSTGQPKANPKPWRTLVESARMNGRAMLGETDGELWQGLATVPAQHMWGLETSVFLPLFRRICMSSKRPFYPEDLRRNLAELVKPRLLVSTPVHLRALQQSGLQLARVKRVLCATAPLSQKLAQEIEGLFEGELCEVYGCSEVGSMARRRTAVEENWELFDGLKFLEADSRLKVSADHLLLEPEIQDAMEFKDAARRTFKLAGRAEDMLEIAGKRGSLAELNKILLSANGVQDGVVFLPEQTGKTLVRPAAIVVARCEKSELQTHFARHVDPVFTPRPIYFVDSLPREDNGKLPRVNLLRFFEALCLDS